VSRGSEELSVEGFKEEEEVGEVNPPLDPRSTVLWPPTTSLLI